MKVDLSISKRKTEWNWTLAFVLYCGGMDPSDILKHQSFRGLTLNHLCNKIQTNAWAKRRAMSPSTKSDFNDSGPRGVAMRVRAI